MERSALLETANIVGCSYLAPLVAGIDTPATSATMPTPPCFARDFPAAVMQAAVAPQALTDVVMLATTELCIEGMPIRCGLVFVPDAACRARLTAEEGSR